MPTPGRETQVASRRLLAADIGGTSARFVAATVTPAGVEIQRKTRYPSEDFGDFDSLLDQYLQDCGLTGTDVTQLTLALPGVINGRQTRLTNLAWQIDADRVQQDHGIAKVDLINDFQAACLGLDTLEEKDTYPLNEQPRQASGVRVITGIGTGLGLAWQLANGKPQMTEGGHVDFAPVDGQQSRLLQYLLKHYPSHVSYERVLSGPGLANLYRFVLLEAEEQGTGDTVHNDPAAINRAAQQGDPNAIETMRLFVRILAAYAGNLAMLFQPFSGLYIGGGMTPRIRPWLKPEEFMEYYAAKGRMASLVRRMPVVLILNEDVGLQGALTHSYKSIISQERGSSV